MKKIIKVIIWTYFIYKNISYEHSKNEKLNYLQTVKVDSSTHIQMYVKCV